MQAARSIVTSIATGIAVAVAIAAPATSASAQNDAGASGSAALPACISVGTEARYVPYGYNHVVLLKNGCSKAATCSVATDVNPQATSVEVAASASVEVLTFTASPAQVFHARVTCKLR
jgi:hypothetical protein